MAKQAFLAESQTPGLSAVSNGGPGMRARIRVPYYLDLKRMALAETLKLRGLNRGVGVPRPCFGAVAPGNRKLMVTNSKT